MKVRHTINREGAKSAKNFAKQNSFQESKDSRVSSTGNSRMKKLAAILTNLPLYEATYAPEPIQFYRIKPAAFDSTPGFELNRELRKAGKGHTLDRKKLLLK